uniref:Uncharacterized protein n=1 Tax=Arundo donax TaxID=35708 RepID=A0A0A9AT39_ARUDO
MPSSIFHQDSFKHTSYSIMETSWGLSSYQWWRDGARGS